MKIIFKLSEREFRLWKNQSRGFVFSQRESDIGHATNGICRKCGCAVACIVFVRCACLCACHVSIQRRRQSIAFPFAFKVWSWPCRVGVRTFVAALCYRASWSCLDALWPPCRAASKYSVFCAVLSAVWCSSAGRGRSAAGLSLAPKANRFNAWSATDRWPTNVEME